MLDDVVDKEAGPKPKLVGPTANVGSVVRHISQDELDAYVEGRLFGTRLDFVRGHLDACEACRAELTDLRTFKASAVGLNQASSLKRELERRRRQRLLKTAATAAVAAAVVAVIGVVGWNKFGKAWVHTASVAATAARASAVAAAAADAQPRRPASADAQRPAAASTVAPTAGAQPHTTPVDAARPTTPAQGTTQTAYAQPHGAAVDAAHPTAPAQGTTQTAYAQPRATPVDAARPTTPAHGATRNAMANGQTTSAVQSGGLAAAVHPATTAAQARGVKKGTGTAVSAEPAAAGSTSFALLGPFGDEVTDDRPEFAWQPLEGATKYSIIVVDEGLRPIAHTRLKTTTWRPKKPLRRGRSYLWQVTAILKNGTKVMARGPTSQEARIHIGAPPK